MNSQTVRTNFANPNPIESEMNNKYGIFCFVQKSYGFQNSMSLFFWWKINGVRPSRLSFASYLRDHFTLDILLLIYRMQFSNVDDSLVKQKIPCNKVYSYEALAFYFPDLLIFWGSSITNAWWLIRLCRFTARLFSESIFSWGIKSAVGVFCCLASCDSRKTCKSLFILCDVGEILQGIPFLHFLK